MRTRNSRLLLVPLFFLRNQMMQSQLMLILLHAAVPAAVAPAVAAAAVAPAVAAAAVAPAVAAATVVPAVAAAAAAPGAAADPYQSIIGAGESVCSYASGKNTCFVYDSVLGGRGGGKQHLAETVSDQQPQSNKCESDNSNQGMGSVCICFFFVTLHDCRPCNG
jgi:hypothetical protein